MAIRIYLDSVACGKPPLRYEAEHENGRFFGFVIRTTASRVTWGPENAGSPILKPTGTEEIPVTLAFERVYGNLVFSDQEQYTEQVAARLGLEQNGVGWKMPEAWLDACPFTIGGRNPCEWGQSYFDVA